MTTPEPLTFTVAHCISPAGWRIFHAQQLGLAAGLAEDGTELARLIERDRCGDAHLVGFHFSHFMSVGAAQRRWPDLSEDEAFDLAGPWLTVQGVALAANLIEGLEDPEDLTRTREHQARILREIMVVYLTEPVEAA